MPVFHRPAEKCDNAMSIAAMFVIRCRAARTTRVRLAGLAFRLVVAIWHNFCSSILHPYPIQCHTRIPDARYLNLHPRLVGGCPHRKPAMPPNPVADLDLLTVRIAFDIDRAGVLVACVLAVHEDLVVVIPPHDLDYDPAYHCVTKRSRHRLSGVKCRGWASIPPAS